MTFLGTWICYASQGDPPRHAATSRLSPDLSGDATAFFVRHAEETLPHLAGAALPLWQFVSPGASGPALLTRATLRRQAGVAAAAVWALLLPQEFLSSPRFALQPCLGLFPPDDPGPAWPAAVDLASLPAASPRSEAVLPIAASYLDAGQVRVPALSTQPATPSSVVLFCQLVELLPPADRCQISFATAPLGMRRVEADPEMRNAAHASAGALARVKLWDRVQRVLQSTDPATSLRQDPQGWLAPLLRRPDLPARVIDLVQGLAGEDLAGELRETTLAWLRKTLEQWLTERATPREVTDTLEKLFRAGLLARAELFPPLWPARVALKLQALGSLSSETLAQVLRPDAAQLLPLILTGLRRGPAAGRTADLVAALAHAPPHVCRQLLGAAAQETLTPLCAQPQRLQEEDGLATALALLAMHYNGHRERSRP